MRLAFAVWLSAILLAGCAMMPAAPASFTGAPLTAQIPSDLPRNARPLHYAISIEPDAAALTFAGENALQFELYQPSDALVLHALELDFEQAAFVDATGQRFPAQVTTSHERQTVRFAAGRMLPAGTYRLETRYTGTINQQAAGLFALDYPDKRTGESARGLFTQFEAPDARRFAPMFDEPSYKATFDLTAIVPAAQLAVSNMPAVSETALGGGRKRVTFATSPLMSSYLLFFASGDFERSTARAADGTELGIVAPAGSGRQARFALDAMAPLIPWFEDYFGTDYPLPKLDNVVAPGQSQFFGAMENWGAILTFESLLLDDPAITTPARRQQIFATQAHEVAHQWFGNIVTMAWWDDLWLNEGFASWLDTKVTNAFHPEWHQNLRRVDVRERAMGLDGFANTHAVISDVRTVSELAQAFDGIAYSKGESVIAMLESYAGEDVWQAGLRRYLARHAYGNTRSRDLWQAMEDEGATGLTAIAEDFTRQEGVPLVQVDGSCVDGQTVLRLSQGQFSLDRKDEVAAAPLRWLVPLRIGAARGRSQAIVLNGTAETHHSGCDSPLIVNAGQSGYFRTIYSPELALRQRDGFAALEPIDQLGLMQDAAALAHAGYQPIDRALALLEALPADANPLVVEFAAGAWAAHFETLAEERVHERAQIAALAQFALAPRLATLGFDAVDGEAVVDSSLRATLIDALGRMGDERVAAEARRRFAMLADDPRALDGPLKTTWLGIASANANAEDWELLSRLAAASTSTAERQTYFTALGDARDPALAQRALDFALTGQAGTTAAAIVDQVSYRHPELAFAFAGANFDAVRALVDPASWAGFYAGLAYTSNDAALLAQLDAIRAALPADEARPFTRVIDTIRVRLENAPQREEALLSWLASRG